MPVAPPGLEIYETRYTGPVRVHYGARQVPLGRKVLLIGLAPGVLPSSPLARQLEHEAEVLSHLDHPNISRLYDLKDNEKELWLVLEDLDGPTLDELKRRELSWRFIAAIGLDLARALIHSHSVGHTHGKLRPEVIQLTRLGRTKLSGFGQHAEIENDQVEALAPTEVGGLSPEASIGQPIGPLSDLFCWGAVMYELLSEKPPFGDVTDAGYATRVRNEKARPLVMARPEVPRGLELLVEQCLEKVPSARPSSALDLARQLENFVGGATLPIIRDELRRLGLSSKEPLLAPTKTSPPPRARARYLVPLLSAVGAALASAGIILTLQSNPQDLAQAPVLRDQAPERSILLRVVATPWAHVLVDGTHRETTPFARPIPLNPGRHVVRLEHPSAPPEERVVDGKAGQSVLLNVQMHVKRPLTAAPDLKLEDEKTP